MVRRDVVACATADAGVARSTQLELGLTPREHEVILLVLEGLTNPAIGRRLGTSHRTVEIQRCGAMRKLGVTTPVALVRRAIRLGWIKP